MATADAQRSREREPEEIAKKAGVDPGTFYRHFPTREELLVAVYRSEMEKRATAERKLSDTLPPGEAFRAWLLLFVDAVETKQIIATVLNTLVGDPRTSSRRPTPKSMKRFAHS